MKSLSSVLFITFFILIVQVQSFFWEFFESFKVPDCLYFQQSTDDLECIENGAQIINSSLLLLYNHQNRTTEGVLLNILSLYQQTEITLNQCQKTFQGLASNISKLLQNQERILNNLKNYYPKAIQDFSSSILLFQRGNYQTSSLLLYDVLYTIFGEIRPEISVRKFYNPKKVVEFDPERFYEEFISNFLTRFFHSTNNETMSKGVAKCMSKNAYIIHNPIREEKVFEALMNVSSWLDEIENCTLSENIDITYLKNFLRFFVNDWRYLTQELFRNFFLKFSFVHKLVLTGLEKAVEGEYLQTGDSFGRLFGLVFQSAISGYLNSFKLEFWESYTK